MEIKRLIVPDSVSNKVSFGRGNPRNYLTVHQTGNTSSGANAMAHHRLQARSGVGYGWHWQVDDEIAIQTHDHSFKIWHAGDGRGKGNTESISIEICVNSDGNYKKSVENGAKLAAMILKEENIDISNMVQHNYWSGKDCPHEIRACKNGICWNDFINMVKKYLDNNDEESEEEEVQEVQERYLVCGNYSIDNLPWWCNDKNNKGTTEKYIGYVVTITRKWGNYWYSQFLDGWVDHRAFTTIITVPETIVKIENEGYSIDNLPWYYKSENPFFKYITSSTEQIGKTFTMTARTSESGGYIYLHEIAKWVDNRAVNLSENSKPQLKSNEEIAKEVIEGKWGNGEDRRNRLKDAGYNYEDVQNEVNRLL